jgi:SpoVK/Ycf46/Vps4 family AAA+-type ATPase
MRNDELLKNQNGFYSNQSPVFASIDAQLKRYAANLIGEIRLTDESLSFFFSVLHPSTLLRIQKDIENILPAREESPRHGKDDPIGSLITRITDLPKDHPPRVCRMMENRIIQLLEQCYRQFQLKNAVPPNMEKLAFQFDLDETEQKILFFYTVLSGNEVFRQLYDRFDDNKKLYLLAKAVDLPVQSVMRRLQKDGRLIGMKLLSETTSHSRYGSYPDYELSEMVSNFIYGFDNSAFRREIVGKDRKKTFPLDAFLVGKTQLSIMQSLLKGPGPCNILLYGQPGTGKTELARTLCRSTGNTCYFLQSGFYEVRQRRPLPGSDMNRIVLLQMAIKIIEEEGGILIVDEADEILNTGNMFSLFFGIPANNGGDKGTINNIMDSHSKKIIWISNRIRGIDDSVLRRFSYSHHFGKNSAGQRMIYWNSLVRKHKMAQTIPPETRKKLAASYQISAGHIGRALETFSSLDTGERGMTQLREILDKQHELVHYGQKKKTESLIPGPQFNPRYLNTDIPVDRIVQALRGKYCGGTSYSTMGTHILFHGVPGTGKTECARYIAEALDKELILKRSSDILSKWVGENEQNIRDAFAEAEADGAVLCIDEADSFFRNRESARSSWEVSFTNELLTQMESFSGVFVCSTNLIDILDPAVMRRFAWKIQFLPLKKKHRAEIVMAYFQFPELTDSDRITFAGIHGLTPGDVKAVWLKYGTSPDLSSTEIADELKRETGYRDTGGSEIGFRE